MTIRIDRLAVRMKGVSAEVGRRAAEGLGEAVLGALADRLQEARLSGNAHVPAIDHGVDVSSTPRTPQQIRSAIVRRVTERIITGEGK